MRATQVAVRKIGPWAPGKYPPFTPVQVILMKELSTGKDIKLSLQKKNQRRVNEWLPAITLGNVLTVTVRSKEADKNGKQEEYIDFMAKFSLDRNLDNDQKSKEKQSEKSIQKKDVFDEAAEIALGLQLRTTEKAIREAVHQFDKLKSDYPRLFGN